MRVLDAAGELLAREDGVAGADEALVGGVHLVVAHLRLERVYLDAPVHDADGARDAGEQCDGRNHLG